MTKSEMLEEKKADVISESMSVNGASTEDKSETPKESDEGEVETWTEKAEEKEEKEEEEKKEAKEKKEEKKTVKDEMADVFWEEFTKESEGEKKEPKGKGKGEDFRSGRWVAFPGARMTGKVRQIVGETEPSEADGVWLTICESPEMPEDSHFKRLSFDLNQEGLKAFETREEAEEYLKEEEARLKKAAKEMGIVEDVEIGEDEKNPQEGEGNPDVVKAQETFKDIKDGDKYTDANGKGWTWTAMEFAVLPEDTKDEEIDDLFSEASIEDKGEGKEAGYQKTISRLNAGGAEGEGEEKTRPSTRITGDELAEVFITAMDGQYAPVPELTEKRRREGWYTDDPSEISPTAWKEKRVQENKDAPPGQRYHIEPYGTEANLEAREYAKQSHRRNVAATWEDCKAKDKARCPYHGAAFMTDQLGAIIRANGVEPGKYGILMQDRDRMGKTKGKGGRMPVMYRIMFSTPEDTPLDVKKKIVRDFLMKNPAVRFSNTELTSDLEPNNSIFYDTDPDLDVNDAPEDAPTFEDYEKEHLTDEQAGWQEREKAAGGAVSYTNFDSLQREVFFNMLSERPKNIVALNDDMLRYAKTAPEYLPEGMDLDKVKGIYDRFKKANATKQGLQAFLLNGEVVDKADALSKAAQKGLQKDGKEYYAAADAVYAAGADVFNAVQNALESKMYDIVREVAGYPSGRDVDVSTSRDHWVPYLGKKYKLAGKRFPTTVGLKTREDIATLSKMYSSSYRQGKKGWDYVRLGCSQREPMLVMHGLEVMESNIGGLKDAAEALGKMQDFIIENQTDRWRRENKIRIPKQPKAKPEKENIKK